MELFLASLLNLCVELFLAGLLVCGIDSSK